MQDGPEREVGVGDSRRSVQRQKLAATQRAKEILAWQEAMEEYRELQRQLTIPQVDRVAVKV